MPSRAEVPFDLAAQQAGTCPAGTPADLVGTPPDDVLRRAAQLEEMVARTHERAADLYETWSGRQNPAGAVEFEQRARRHRELAAASRSVEHLAERTLSAFAARVDVGSGRTGKARQLVVLAAFERLRALTDRRIAETVVSARRDAATWTEIAAALGVTRQTAHERYRHRSE